MFLFYSKAMKCFFLLVLIIAPGIAGAYVIGPTTPGKWGDPTFGTGAHITYSFMSGGQVCDHSRICVALIDFMPSGYQAEIKKAFDTWEAVANLTFEETVDDASNWNIFTSSGDIRLAGHFLDGRRGRLAHSYFPPVNGTSASGDVHFDTAELWEIGFGGSGIDVYYVALHEIGHSLGLDHEDSPGVVAVMNSFYPKKFIGLQADDIAGIQYIYGAAVVPVPAAVWLFASGIIGLIGMRKKNIFSQLSN